MAEDKPRPRPRRKPAAARAPAATPRKPRTKRVPAPVAVTAAPAPVESPSPSPPSAREVPAREGQGPGGLYEAIWRTGVLNVLALVRREFTSYFVSPVGYIVAGLLVPAVSLIAFLPPLSQGSPISMAPVYDWVVYFSVFVAPLLTMGLLAEERRSGTLELLLTSPVRDWELVVGKWLGAMAFFVAVTAFLLPFVVVLVHYQSTNQVITLGGLSLSIGNLDLGATISGYLGVLMVGAAMLGVGVLTSSLTRNQLVAAFVGFLLGLVLSVVAVGASFLPAQLFDFSQYLAIYAHFETFNQGRVTVRDVVYFLALTIGALFLATRVLESRRWR